ncbi:restriction endonuclease subunit S [Enterococcus faecalis]|nr:restriction endonuclease subunit S [Enterococcus faecalis]WCG26235.1 restriction endonuclease subunit S [Enterococcus faecalis]
MCKLGDVADHFEYGLNASAIEYDGKNKYLRITDIDDSSRKFIQNKLTSPNINVEEASNYILTVGDILFARTGASVGKTYRYDIKDGKVYFAGFLIRARIKDSFDSEFVYWTTLTDRYNTFIKIMSQRSGQPGINAKEYSSFNILIPNIKEQQKIGAFLKKIDDTIALHQRKLDQLKELKKAYLKAMLISMNTKNNKVPKLRFADFEGEWDQRKFKAFSKKTGKKNSQNLNYPAYSVSNKSGLISQSEQFNGNRLDTLEKHSYKIVEPYEFAYNPARINVGSIAFNTLGKPVIVSSLYVVLQMEDNLNNDFILQFIKSPAFVREVKRNTEGSVREYLFYENFANIKFPYTKNIKEQQKIGAFFKKSDDTIALRQNKLNQLKALKKAYLQNMFI